MKPNPSRKFDYIEKSKIAVGDLAVGMYVCELDRPWLDTPYLLQGFEIKDDGDIAELQRHCEFVYIDLQRTKTLRVDGHTVRSNADRGHTTRTPRSFGKELEAAKAVQAQTTGLVKGFFEDIRDGRSLDTQQAKSAVSECVASVIRNSAALGFLTQLKHRDEYTSQHSFNVCILALILGRQQGMSNKDLEQVGLAALLHDMGKIKVPLEILNKPGRFTPEEFEIMKRHTTYGRDILVEGANVLGSTIDAAYGHHENLDGTGYPRGLQASQIGVFTKYVAIVDKYDAMSSDRVYQAGRTHAQTLDVLNDLASNNKIDAGLVRGFAAAVGVFPPGSVLELSSGEIAVALAPNLKQRLRPQVVIVRDEAKQAVPQRLVDLADAPSDRQGNPYCVKRMLRNGDFGVNVAQYQDLIAQALG